MEFCLASVWELAVPRTGHDETAEPKPLHETCLTSRLPSHMVLLASMLGPFMA